MDKKCTVIEKTLLFVFLVLRRKKKDSLKHHVHIFPISPAEPAA